VPSDELVGTEFLQLVRFGLRRAEDPLILSSLRVVDALLKTETPCGPDWHRYKGDCYGEKDDSRPYDGTGHGRGWPLLTGERGHYELAAERDPLPFLAAMTGMASSGGMLPEQVWDAEPIPSRRSGAGTAKRLGDAARLGTCRVNQADGFAPSRTAARPAARGLATLPGRRPAGRHTFW